MSESEVTFEDALTLTGSEAVSHAQIGNEWAQGRATFGGLVAGLMVRALERQLPAERALRSCLISFVGPTAPGEATVEAKLVRVGRALTHGEARLLQKGEPCAVMLAAYGERRQTSLTIAGPTAPDIGTAEASPRLPYVEGVMPRFTKQIEFRVAGGRIPFTGAERASLSGYMRYARGGPSDAAGLLGLIDAWPPPVLAKLKKFAPASTVTWMVDVVGELPARGTQSDAFYRYEAECSAADGGYASCEARIWGPDERLVAISRQMVAEFS
jgi:acyl-CoA thioesterase